MSFRFEIGLNARLPRHADDGKGIFLIGEDVDFSDPQVHRQVCAGGWSVAEPLGTWSEGRAAHIALRIVDAGDAPCILWLAGYPFVTAIHALTMTCACNGMALSPARFERGLAVRHVLKITLPPLPDDGSIRLDLAFDDLSSPKEQGFSDDARLLGFLAGRVCVTRADAPAPPLFEGVPIPIEPPGPDTALNAATAAITRLEQRLRALEERHEAMAADIRATRETAGEARDFAAQAAGGIDRLAIDMIATARHPDAIVAAAP